MKNEIEKFNCWVRRGDPKLPCEKAVLLVILCPTARGSFGDSLRPSTKQSLNDLVTLFSSVYSYVGKWL